jgi:hypothetical protein
MSTMYGILATVGWVFAALFFSVIGIVAWKRRRRATAAGRGFEVLSGHDKPR